MRYDSKINAHLSEYSNSILEELWMTNNCPKRIVIAKQDLECEGITRIQSYGNSDHNNYDGIHLRGPDALPFMTRSFIKMLTNTFPHLNQKN